MLPAVGVPVTETFEPAAKSIVPPVVQVLSKATASSTAPAFCTCRLVIVPKVVVDPLVYPRTNPFVLTCTTPAAPARFKLAEFAEVVLVPATTVVPQLVREPPVGIFNVPFETKVFPL